ncbi:uncharacterized protein L203_101889 [Cryptococcus depauperatus CBS 7841]|uniref:BTB domain-containing protein n=1 Tax=Cryptococcus depauperatus CBS 7841 TaxID=1295531 RepID=A0AAJ8M0N3_9TREE
MPNLHTHFFNSNVKAFRQELDGTAGGSFKNNGGSGTGIEPGSASGGKSWAASGMTMQQEKADPNEKDMWGRTVLHLAASSLAPMSYTFFQILLRHPQIQVNNQDTESGYTALHRALYAGNIRAAKDLLIRHDIDPTVKDMEGIAAYELYNGTIDGTNPSQGANGTDLFVWGVNRNFTLGTGDTSDRMFPDRISLQTQAQGLGRFEPSDKFSSVGVRDVIMSKLHTGVITSEASGNLSLCGFGANGRLGRSIHSQLALVPLPGLQHTIISIALGQDHTLALTSGGFVLSWGHNRFSQLGYVIEPSEKPAVMAKNGDDLVQITPKKIVGPLKKEFITGVAAGRMASACWSSDAVWTWGTNAGHLGYDKSSNPVQSVPRRVTSITEPVADIAFSDYAMICLLNTSEVICFHGDAHFKISFSIPRSLPEAFPFRPPQTTLKPMISKITSSSGGFAALSTTGDVFTFSLPNPMEELNRGGRHVVVKPQIVWALRKKFTAVKDLAIGSDGTIIVCTTSGHVFVRQRLKVGSGQLKFRRVPYLQRIIRVACNESGAFAAIRVDTTPTPIKVIGNSLEEDLAWLQPHFRRFSNQMTEEDFERLHVRERVENDEGDENESSNSVGKDTMVVLKMCTILSRWRPDDRESLFAWSKPLLNSDCHLVVAGLAIPAHSVILSTRAKQFAWLLAGECKSELFHLSTYGSSPAINIKACHPLVGLLLMQYLYSDDVAAIWDPRVTRVVQDRYKTDIVIGDIKPNLKAIADELGLTPLSSVLAFTSKQPIPKKTLASDLQNLFNTTSFLTAGLNSPCDIQIIMYDKTISCSSVVLRARCPFFDAMFSDDDWTAARKGQNGVVVQMRHLKWSAMKLVFRWIYEGVEDKLFDCLHQDTLDDFLDFVFEVLATATELLLDRLVLVCSRIILRHCNVFNAAAIATEASFYQATALLSSTMAYIIVNLETMLESGLLDEMPPEVLQHLENEIAMRQEAYMPATRSNLLVKNALAKHQDWLSLQDIPRPIIRQPFRWRARPNLSPVEIISGKNTPQRKPMSSSFLSNADVQAQQDQFSVATNGIFQMDDDIPALSSPTPEICTPRSSRSMTPINLGASATQASVPPSASRTNIVWKSKAVETGKADLRSIMAEAEAARISSKTSSSSAVAYKTPGLSRDSSLPTPTTTPTRSGMGRIPSNSDGANSPRKAAEIKKASFATLQEQKAQTSPSMSPSQACPVPQKPIPKVITPVKLPFSHQGQVSRKVSACISAWSTPATPVPPTTSVSPTASGISLLAIQRQEKEIAETRAKKPVKSLREIQEEEKQREAEKQQEEEFMRWWHEEETKIAKENGQGRTAQGHQPSGSKSGKDATGKGKGKSNGRGQSGPNGHRKSEKKSTGPPNSSGTEERGSEDSRKPLTKQQQPGNNKKSRA